MFHFVNNNKQELQLNEQNMPKHIAIIMDGNGRWAAKRALPKKAGHRAGAKTLENISQSAIDLGIEHLTVYAFSTENWKRSDEEVKGIMDLLREYLKNYITFDSFLIVILVAGLINGFANGIIFYREIKGKIHRKYHILG